MFSMKKRIIYLILLVLWMGVIFYFSSQNSESSTKQSDVVINNGIIRTIKIFNKNITDKEEANIYIKLFYVVRKNAHIFEYFILGLLSFLFINTYDMKVIKKYCIVLLFCFLYACSDEFHQSFIMGRTSSVKDVFIDTFGVLVALIIIYLIYVIKNKKIVYNKTKIL